MSNDTGKSTAPATTKTKKSKTEDTNAQARVFRQTQTLHHDLFILTPERMLKDVSLQKDGEPESLVPVQHQHFFHTIDSQGRKLTYCSPIGGHFHEIEVIDQGEGQPPLVKCISGPLKWAMKKKGGKFRRVTVPANDFDNHTHDMQYLQSEKITPRKANVEAAKVTAAIQAKETASGHGLGGQVLES